MLYFKRQEHDSYAHKSWLVEAKKFDWHVSYFTIYVDDTNHTAEIAFKYRNINGGWPDSCDRPWAEDIFAGDWIFVSVSTEEKFCESIVAFYIELTSKVLDLIIAQDTSWVCAPVSAFISHTAKYLDNSYVPTR